MRRLINEITLQPVKQIGHYPSLPALPVFTSLKPATLMSHFIQIIYNQLILIYLLMIISVSLCIEYTNINFSGHKSNFGSKCILMPLEYCKWEKKNKKDVIIRKIFKITLNMFTS